MDDVKESTPLERESSGMLDRWDNLYEAERGSWIIAGAILLGSLIISASLMVATKPKAADTAAVGGTGTTAPTQPNAPQPTQNGSVSLGNAPLQGDKTKAKVAIVEFSDFECPFCKKFHQDTFDQLVKDYVSTGKAVIAYKNYPLPFHEPKASVAAETAECVRAEKGDAAFFNFAKAYYGATQANGKGLPATTTVDSLISQAGANPATVNQCASSEKYKDAIAKDTSDGQAVGVNGTPSFLIGKLDASGKVTGELVVGALPYAQFKTTLDKYLQ